MQYRPERDLPQGQLTVPTVSTARDPHSMSPSAGISLPHCFERLKTQPVSTLPEQGQHYASSCPDVDPDILLSRLWVLLLLPLREIRRGCWRLAAA